MAWGSLAAERLLASGGLESGDGPVSPLALLLARQGLAGPCALPSMPTASSVPRKGTVSPLLNCRPPKTL